MTRSQNAFVAGLAALLCLVLAGQWLLGPAADPASSPEPRTIDIPGGTTLAHVASLLDEAGLIRSTTGFTLLGALTGADRRVRPGEYEFHAGMGPLAILRTLEGGKVKLHQVTIPEGFSVAQIADRLAAQELVDRAVFLALSQDETFIRSLELNVSTLEGYLFPTTYHFPRRADPKEIVRTMVAFTHKAFTPELRARADQMGMTMNEVLTLASVIEKETGVAAERELISAVFHNRLRRNIPLQSDPTVIYALEGFDGNLRKRDLSVQSPYNTYQVRGLPPGPIANPGAESIHAALYPAKTSYLYFVSRNDGTHHFSSTLAEHNRAVDKYQRRITRNLS